MDFKSTISEILKIEVPESRQLVLEPLIQYVQNKRDANEEIVLNFICTHNSRRSQFAQIWAKVAAAHYCFSIVSLSGGVEVTAFNPRAIKSLNSSGFKIEEGAGDNPKVSVSWSENVQPLVMFSKLFDDEVNQFNKFAAVMTCDHADENCPFIPGTEQRISVNYTDPKEFDDTKLEDAKYDERSMQIASEMFYVFSKIE